MYFMLFGFSYDDNGIKKEACVAEMIWQEGHHIYLITGIVFLELKLEYNLIFQFYF